MLCETNRHEKRTLKSVYFLVLFIFAQLLMTSLVKCVLFANSRLPPVYSLFTPAILSTVTHSNRNALVAGIIAY